MWTPLVSQYRFTSTLWYIYGSTVTVHFLVEIRGSKPSEKSQGCPTSQVQCPKPLGEDVMKHITKKELSLHVRRKTYRIHVTTMRISNLPEEFSGPQRNDTLGVPLLDCDCIWTIWESEQDIAYLQHPEVVQLYTKTSKIVKGGRELPLFRCSRGSTSFTTILTSLFLVC